MEQSRSVTAETVWGVLAAVVILYTVGAIAGVAAWFAIERSSRDKSPGGDSVIDLRERHERPVERVEEANYR